MSVGCKLERLAGFTLYQGYEEVKKGSGNSRKLGRSAHSNLDISVSSAFCLPISVPFQIYRLCRAMSEIDCLPNAILVAIFDLVPPLEVINNCCLVSKRFLDVSLSPDLWRNKVNGLPQVRNVHRFPCKCSCLMLATSCSVHFLLYVTPDERYLITSFCASQVLTDRLEARSQLSYAKIWYGLYNTNMLSNANWGNITDHRNWLMPPANGMDGVLQVLTQCVNLRRVQEYVLRNHKIQEIDCILMPDTGNIIFIQDGELRCMVGMAGSQSTLLPAWTL